MRLARCLWVLLTGIALATAAHADVLVESVDPFSAGSAAGIRPGDILREWERLDAAGAVAARGRFAEPFDARAFEVEQAPRGITRISLLRSSSPTTLLVKPGYWGIATGMVPTDLGDQTLYQRGLDRVRAQDPEGAQATWRSLLQRLTERRQVRRAIWLRCRIAAMMIDPASSGQSDWIFGETRLTQVDGLFADAARLARRLGDKALLAMVYEATGRPWIQDLPFSSAIEVVFASGGRTRPPLEKAYAIRNRIAPDSLLTAASALSLGLGYDKQDNITMPPEPEKARRMYLKATAIRRRIIPGSYDAAVADYRLALLTLRYKLMRTLPERERRIADLRHAFEVIQATVADKDRLGYVALYPGVPLWQAAAPADARRFYRIALEANPNQRPSYDQSNCGPCLRALEQWNEIGNTYLQEWRLEDAKDAFEKALPLTSDPVSRRWTLYNLAFTASMAGDRAEARRRLVALLDPGTTRAPQEDENAYRKNRAEVLHRLAGEVRDSGDVAASALYNRAALSLQAALPAPTDDGSRSDLNELTCDALGEMVEDRQSTIAEDARFDAACADWWNLSVLSRAALARGQTGRAIEYSTKAAQQDRRGSPETGIIPFNMGRSLLHLGRAQCAAGMMEPGIRNLTEARRVLQRNAPRAVEYVETLRALGQCAAKGGRPLAAAASFERAVAVLESFPPDQIRSRLSGAFLASQWAATYAEWSAVLADLRRPVDAFAALERGRAQAFRAALAARSVLDQAPSGPSNDRRRQLWVDYDRIERRLQGPPEPTPAERERLQAELQALAVQMDALNSNAGARSTTRAPDLDLATATAALPESAALIEYSVLPERTLIFVVQRSVTGPAVHVTAAPVGSRALRTSVAALRSVLERPRSTTATLQEQARQLYDTLLRPVEGLVGSRPRLVIVPDGPLTDLAFASLVTTGSQAPVRYLIERSAITLVPSAATLAQLLALPRVRRDAIVAVGGALPAPGPTASDTALLRDESDAPDDQDVDTGDDPAQTDDEDRSGAGALPGSRREVDAIAQLFSPHVRLLVGADATEEKVKLAAPSARVLHLATHAVVNGVLPLNAGLRLSPSLAAFGAAPDNGLLQAWEIMEQLRLDADLVTLSACESGRGRVLAGEGALSLARAFHYAGARSVVSTLWSVNDTATAELMKMFYSGLKDGLKKDEALRRAQLAFINAGSATPGWTAPAYWAAFELSGDWR